MANGVRTLIVNLKAIKFDITKNLKEGINPKT